MQRNTVSQRLNQFVIPVLTTAVPLNTSAQYQSAFVDSFLLCVYSTAANSVFFGDSTVLTTTGMEIPTGVTVQFSVDNERPRYELQDPLLRMAAQATCQAVDAFGIPFIYWDLSQLFLIAAANTNVVCIPFARMFV